MFGVEALCWTLTDPAYKVEPALVWFSVSHARELETWR
jgi:hypothetical protein